MDREDEDDPNDEACSTIGKLSSECTSYQLFSCLYCIKSPFAPLNLYKNRHYYLPQEGNGLMRFYFLFFSLLFSGEMIMVILLQIWTCKQTLYAIKSWLCRHGKPTVDPGI